MEITSQTNPANTGSAAKDAQAQLGVDVNSFLLLLTAQISNQDPLEPMDSTTFVSQLAQLSQVEQAITTNDNLENIGQQFTNFTELSGVQLLGREVVLASDKLDLNSGQATINYELTGEAQQVSVRVLGLNGEVIKEITDLSGEVGTRHTVHWDGLSSSDLQVADGAYTFEVVAIDSESEPVSYTSFAITNVEELTFSNGQPTLLLRNNQEVPSTSILAVR